MTALAFWTRLAIVVLVVGSTLVFGWYVAEVVGRLREPRPGGNDPPGSGPPSSPPSGA